MVICDMMRLCVLLLLIFWYLLYKCHVKLCKVLPLQIYYTKIDVKVLELCKFMRLTDLLVDSFFFLSFSRFLILTFHFNFSFFFKFPNITSHLFSIRSWRPRPVATYTFYRYLYRPSFSVSFVKELSMCTHVSTER